MKVAIYSNDGSTSNKVASQLKAKIEASDKLEYDGLNPQIVISVGGDGTLLSAFHHYKVFILIGVIMKLTIWLKVWKMITAKALATHCFTLKLNIVMAVQMIVSLL